MEDSAMSTPEVDGLISFRINGEAEDCEAYWTVIKDYLKYRETNINEMICGYHPNSGETPHMHFHLTLIDIPNSKTCRLHTGQDFKNYLAKEGIKIFDGKRKFSAKYSQSGDTHRFMQYPLKEGILLKSIEFTQEELQQMTADAQAEYKAKLQFEKVEAERKAFNDRKKGQLYKHLDSIKLTSCYQVCRETLNYYKLDQDAPHPRIQLQSAEKYAYHKGLWDFDEILVRYYPALTKEKVLDNYLKTYCN